MKSKRLKRQDGFTLIEAIVAIAIASIGLILICSLIAVSLDINIKAQGLLNDSLKINSLADQLKKEKNQDGEIDQFLQVHYPEFVLIDCYETEVEHLWMLKVEHDQKKTYYIAYSGVNND